LSVIYSLFSYFQLDTTKKELEVSLQVGEESETAKQKSKRETEELRAELEKVQSDFQRAEKAKKKLQGELDDTVVQMERERNNAAQMTSKQKKFDAQLAEERARLQSLSGERDNIEKTARNNETKVLSLQNANAELEDRLAEVQFNFFLKFS